MHRIFLDKMIKKLILTVVSVFGFCVFCFNVAKTEQIDNKIPVCTSNILKNIKGFLIDIDGTVRMYDTFSGSSEMQRFQIWLHQTNVPHVYLTNSFTGKKYNAEKLYKIYPVNDEKWLKQHIWTAADAIVAYLEDRFYGKKLNILVLSTTKKSSNVWDSCYQNIRLSASKEGQKNWQIRLDVPFEEILEWSNATMNGTAQSVVVSCPIGDVNDPFGGRLDILLNPETNKIRPEFENVVDPVYGLQRAAYKKFDSTLLDKVNVLLRNNGVFVSGHAERFYPRKCEVGGKYKNIDCNIPSTAGYDAFFRVSAGFDLDQNKMKNYYAITGKGGRDGTQFMILKAFQLLKKQNKSLTDDDIKNIAIIGDNLQSDIKAGNAANITSIFVLSGVHTLENMKKSLYRPTCYLPHVGEIPNLMNHFHKTEIN